MKPRRPWGRHWTVLGMAFGAVARAGEPFGQRHYPGSPAAREALHVAVTRLQPVAAGGRRR